MDHTEKRMARAHQLFSLISDKGSELLVAPPENTATEVDKRHCDGSILQQSKHMLEEGVFVLPVDPGRVIQ